MGQALSPPYVCVLVIVARIVTEYLLNHVCVKLIPLQSGLISHGAIVPQVVGLVLELVHVFAI